MTEALHNNEHENTRDPRVESLAEPLARDYAEKNYNVIGEDENGEPIFESAWRGANGEKEYRNKTPAEVAESLIDEGWTPEAAQVMAESKVIDIANTPYSEYTEHWKNANRGGAEFLIGLLDERGRDWVEGVDLSDEASVSEVGDLIHNNWLKQNEWVLDPNYGNPDLAKPFDELAEAEQSKDIDQFKILVQWLQDQKQA